MKKATKFLVSIFMILAVPMISLAQRDPVHGLVACTGEDCNFTALLDLINNVIKFILVDLAVPIAAIMFAYAGFLLITSGGAEGKTKAKTIFTNTAMGLIFIAASWLIIHTILSILSPAGTTPWAWIGF